MKLSILIYLCSLSLFMVHCNSSTEKDSMDNETTPNIEMISEITCPHCGHKKTETMPTDVCRIKYTCENCNTELVPKDGDCCVFCTHGNHKCPSMQEN